MLLITASVLGAFAARRFAIGIDVGTGSARAGIVDVQSGALVAVHKQSIKTWTPLPEHHEQSSDDIWAACAACVRQAMSSSGVASSEIVGLGFDATCSLVCLDEASRPVGIDPTVPMDDERNIILWMDHRANEQAAAINALGHERLAQVGGTISPEMEIPKIKWLRDHLPEAFDRSKRLFDLSDFLVHRATDYQSEVRSLCTTVCKWNYDVDAQGGGRGWDRTFLRAVGFHDDELPPSCIGADVQPPGARVPGGLGPAAAEELGLDAGVPLAVGIIDAHAGGIGSLGVDLPGSPALAERLALIAGTSTCHMASSADPCFVPGVWGPYYGAMLPGMYLNEGGQSAAGALLDHIISSHAAYPELQAIATAAQVPPSLALNQRLEQMAEVRWRGSTEPNRAPTGPTGARVEPRWDPMDIGPSRTQSNPCARHPAPTRSNGVPMRHKNNVWPPMFG